MRRILSILMVLLATAGLALAEKYDFVVTNWDFNTNNGGFTVSKEEARSGIAVNPWTWSGTNWYINGESPGGTADWELWRLSSTNFSLPRAGTLKLEFDHRPGFGDADGSGAWDWGMLEYALRGSTNMPPEVPSAFFTSNSYNTIIKVVGDTWQYYSGGDIYRGLPVWSDTVWPGTWKHSVATFGTVNPSDPFRFAFAAGWDWSYVGGTPQWQIDNVKLTIAVSPVQNSFPTNVTTTSAFLNGYLLSTGSAPTAVFAYWGTTDGSNNAASWANTNVWAAPQAVGNFSYAATSLVAGTAYYYRFSSTNSLGREWADASQRFVATNETPPVVGTLIVSGVGIDDAVLNGVVLSGNPTPYCWFYYGTADGGTNPAAWSNSVVAGQPEGTSFWSLATGLAQYQQYWYRVYATNSSGTAWAPSSTNFVTGTVGFNPTAVSVWEPAAGTTSSVPLLITLGVASVLPVTLTYATVDGTATVAGGEYVAVTNTVTIPAGSLSTQVVAQVIGKATLTASRFFIVRILSADTADLANNNCFITIDKRRFVRPTGSDTNNGTGWDRAWLTLQKALNAVADGVPVNVMLEATSGSQYYSTCLRNYGGLGSTLMKHWFVFNVQGGWQNVDTAPVQTGMSSIQSPATNTAGIYTITQGHCGWQNVTVNCCSFANVTEGVHTEESASSNAGGVYVNMSNTVVRANTNGVMVRYAHPFAPIFAGVASGPCQFSGTNVDIVGGLGGYGNAYCSEGQWFNSSVTAVGLNPTTGVANVSSLSSSNGSAISLTTVYPNATYSDYATVNNTVIQGCTTNAVYLSGGSSGSELTLRNCTIADNGGNGIYGTALGNTSYIAMTNCIVANNGGTGVSLTNANFKCNEAYNVFYNDGILTNGVAKALNSTTLPVDPKFKALLPKPEPYYYLQSYLKGSDAKNRGAYQNAKGGSSTLIPASWNRLGSENRL